MNFLSYKKLNFVNKIVDFYLVDFLSFFLFFIYNNLYYSYNCFIKLNFFERSKSLLYIYIYKQYYFKYNIFSGLYSIFFSELFLDGLYFRVKYYKKYNILGFILGYNHYILYKLPDEVKIFVHMKRRRLFIYSFNLEWLHQVSFELVNLKYPNLFKGKGVKLINYFYRKKILVKKSK